MKSGGQIEFLSSSCLWKFLITQDKITSLGITVRHWINLSSEFFLVYLNKLCSGGYTRPGPSCYTYVQWLLQYTPSNTSCMVTNAPTYLEARALWPTLEWVEPPQCTGPLDTVQWTGLLVVAYWFWIMEDKPAGDLARGDLSLEGNSSNREQV